MNRSGNLKIVLWLSIPLAALVVFVSIEGLTTPNFYAAETSNWAAQSLGQDMADLFLVVPALIISSFLAYHKRKAALLVWGGVVAYLLYTFLIYCFALHFNQLFVFYCLILGLSFYSMLWFFNFQLNNKTSIENFNKVPASFIAVYFMIIAVLFYFLWLAEILPAILKGETPASVKETGLLTNAVHVIDLSVVLPGIFITGLLLFKRKFLGYIMAPLLLSFFILMDLTICGLIIVMKNRGMEANIGIAMIMVALAIFSALLLVWYTRRMTLFKTE